MRRSDDQALPQASQIGPVLSELLSVANIAALAPLTYGDGTGIYVRSVRDYFVYRASSTATADAITVVAHASGTGRWERLNIPHPSWTLQGLWFVDPVAGSDEAVGSTTGTAVKTSTELNRRLGVSFTLRTDTTITIMSSLPATESLDIDVLVSSPYRFILQGTPTVAFSGTASAKNDRSIVGAGSMPDVTSSWTVATHVGRIVKDVTNNRYAIVARDLTGGRAKVANWLSLNEVSGGRTGTITAGNSTVGASLEVYTLPVVTRANITVRGTRQAGNSQATAVVQKLEFGTTETLHLTALNTSISWQNCRFMADCPVFGAGTHFLNNCYVDCGAPWADYVPFIIMNGGVWARQMTNTAVMGGVTMELCLGALFQGAGCLMNRGSLLRLRDTVFEDLGAVTAIQLFDKAQAKGSSGGTVCGTGNTGLAFLLGAGGCVSFTGGAAALFRLTAAVAPISFSGQTTCPALDPATFLPNATARSLTFANIDATYAAGGFGGGALDPRNGCYFGTSSV